MVLTSEEKRLRRIDRAHQKLKELQIGTIFNKHPSGLCCLMQRLVRLAASDDNGICQCVTCGKRDHFSEMHGGHFVGRNNKAVCIDERNINVQCVNCNTFEGGKAAEYRAYMLQKHGEAVVLELERAKFPKNHVWNRYELAVRKIDMRDEIKAHEKRIGV